VAGVVGVAGSGVRGVLGGRGRHGGGKSIPLWGIEDKGRSTVLGGRQRGVRRGTGDDVAEPYPSRSFRVQHTVTFLACDCTVTSTTSPK
jgi:hypothetical protein